MKNRQQRRHPPATSNGTQPQAPPEPQLTGIQRAILELAAGFGHPTLAGRRPDGASRSLGGSRDAWLAVVTTEPLPELLALLQMLCGAALGQQQRQPEQRGPRLYGPDGGAVL
jgi:hypothetical protein